MKIIEVRENGTKRVHTKNDQPSKTSQEFKKDCDVNEVVKRFSKTGVWPGRGPGTYADVSQVSDLMGAIEVVQSANEQFSELPANVRKRFRNNPVELVRFLEDPKNNEEAVKLGLLERTKKGTEKNSRPPASAKARASEKKSKTSQSEEPDSDS